MKKKPKISYRDLARAAEPTPAATPTPPAAQPVAPAPVVLPEGALVQAPRELARVLNAGRAAEDAPAPRPATAPAAPAVTAPARVDVVVDVDGASRAGESLRARAEAREGVVDLLLFRIGHELFAADLADVDEALDLDQVHPVPEMPESMLGIFRLRGRVISLYSPSHVLHAPLAGPPAAAILVATSRRATAPRIGLAVDDVEDVIRIDLSTLRGLPSGDDDAVLLGVAHHGTSLVAVVDAAALAAACVSGRTMETA